ncbi:MAG: sugar kinase [Treponema sp.]|jgi:xylulokinase|nr:sugar kinase [Treponema sp.]
MRQRLFFCADLGTSSLKAALIDNSGYLHGFVRIPFGNRESTSIWLDAFYKAAEQLSFVLEKESGSYYPLSAIIISGSGPSLVPVIGNGPETAESLRPLYWYDPAVPIEGGFSSVFLPKVKNFCTAKECKITNRITYFISPQEWLSWKLGADPVTVLPHDGYVPYYWDDDQCSRLGIKKDWFPPFVTMGTVIGELKDRTLTKDDPAAKLFFTGIPIMAGASDFIMSLIGTGTLEPGKACDRTGSSEGINLCVPPGHKSSAEGLRFLPHAISGLWNLGAVIPKSGILFDEYRSASGQEEKPYRKLIREIFADPSHPGKIVLETIGRAFVQALEDVEGSGHIINELTLSGGQCTDPLWNQYKADISGRVLLIPEIVHAELAGNAVLCEAVILKRSIRETAAEMIRIKETYIPRL